MTEPDFITATRASYDAVATAYADAFPDELAGRGLDRALIAAFAEFVRSEGPAPDAPVADIGCGPGHVTAYLRGLGLPMFGIDLSPAMVALAREAHPGLRFQVGSMTSLDLPDASLGGVTAFYSTIHVPDDELPTVFREFHRVLAPGGQLLLAFQAGDERLRLTERFGRTVALDCHWRRPDDVARLLDDAGLPTRARVVREPGEGEKLPRAFLLARRPPAG